MKKRVIIGLMIIGSGQSLRAADHAHQQTAQVLVSTETEQGVKVAWSKMPQENLTCFSFCRIWAATVLAGGKEICKDLQAVARGLCKCDDDEPNG